MSDVKQYVKSFFLDFQPPLYQDYICFMIDNQDYCNNTLFAEANKNTYEQKCLCLLKKEKQKLEDSYENHTAPWFAAGNYNIPSVHSVIDIFYQKEIILIQIKKF